jgi:hypothetical protein
MKSSKYSAKTGGRGAQNITHAGVADKRQGGKPSQDAALTIHIIETGVHHAYDPPRC